MFHLYVGERISSARACKELVRRTLTRFRIPYITVTPTFSICPRHGYLVGEHEYCPQCDAEQRPSVAGIPGEIQRQTCEIWTRVMGYYRPVSQFNRGKQSEFQERRFFAEPSEPRTELTLAQA